MCRQVSLIGAEQRGSSYGWTPSVSGRGDSEEAATHPSSRGLLQPLEAVRNVTRSPKRSSSSRSGESSDLVSERTPESSLAEEEEEELLSPLLSEWKSAEDEELGVTSGKERLLLWLGAPSVAVTSAGANTAVTSNPGDKVLLARFRFMGGGSSLGIICLHLPRKNRKRLARLGQPVEASHCSNATYVPFLDIAIVMTAI